MNIHYFQHVPFEGLGMIAEWLHAAGMQTSATKFYEDNIALPDPSATEALIVLGGPMGVYDEDQYPWLGQEKDFILEVIKADKPVLGICLGAQLIASALGADVYPGKKEIGWAPVSRVQEGRFFQNLPGKLTVLHWHGDTFDLPAGAVHLARNDITLHQAFEYNHALGLQFHFEMGPPQAGVMLENCGDELDNSPNVQKPDEIRAGAARYVETNRKILFQILDRLFLSHEKKTGPPSIKLKTP